PSRASIQRAQYVHNHQVLSNRAPDGGFEKFHALHEEESTIGTWVKATGYRTGFMGKYLSGYPNTAAPTYVPPGWDDWHSPAAGNPYSEYNYTLNENGNLARYGLQPQEEHMDHLYRRRLQSMLAVQDLIEHLLDTLRTMDQLEHTYLVFASDNGFHMG